MVCADAEQRCGGHTNDEVTKTSIRNFVGVCSKVSGSHDKFISRLTTLLRLNLSPICRLGPLTGNLDTGTLPTSALACRRSAVRKLVTFPLRT
jgi:hypothetical protein